MTKTELLLVTLWVFVLILSTVPLVDSRWAKDYEKSAESSEEKRELLGVLQKVLEKLQNKKTITWERKHSRLPECHIGDFCTVKKGSRFGQLCDCPRGAKCNLFFLKCL